MKKSLLATVAAVALIASAGMASAAEDTKAPPKAGHAEMNKGADVKAGAEMKAEPKADMKADNKTNGDMAKPSTTGQASEQKSAPPAKSSTNEKAAPGAKSSTNEKAAPATGSSAQGMQSPAAKSSAQSTQSTTQTSAAVNLTPEQKTKIRTTVVQSSSAPKMSRNQINFSLNIGSPVPRSVHFVEVPPTLVEIHPQWRGYRYFVVDDEIVIVDPRTLHIVAILEV